MSQPTVKISFPGKTNAEAGDLAEDLEGEIRMFGEDVTVERFREIPDAQDFGASLLLILGTAAVTEVARGIAAWMRRTGTDLEIKIGDKQVVIKNVDSSNLPDITAALVAALSGTQAQP